MPVRRTSTAATPVAPQSGQTLGRGMDFALVVLVFVGIGYGLDRWLGTRPLFMIGLVVFSVVGQFIKMYYDYTATMQELEAERAAGSVSQRGEAESA
jgi:F0F1-type ATP synthase assembly protein I